MVKPNSGSQIPTKLSSALVTWSVTAYTVLALCFSLIVSLMDASQWYTILLLVIFGGVLLGILVMISRQPRSRCELSFTVPLVPWLPGVSILINIYLMTQLDVMTWVRFIVWIAVGLVIYFAYGVFHSQLRYKRISSSARQITESDEGIDTVDTKSYGSLDKTKL